jgi:hypothetical protein
MRSEVFEYSVGYCRPEGFEYDFKRAEIERVNASKRFSCNYEFGFLFSSVNVHTGLCHI